MKKVYVFGYVRLSTVSTATATETDTAQENNSKIETQKLSIENYCYSKKKFPKNSLEFFVDDGVSGTTPVIERKGFKDLFIRITAIRKSLNEAENSSKIHVVVYHPDRFSRDDLIFGAITNFFSDKCVNVHYVSEEGEGNGIILKFKSIIAEQERRNTIRRINQFYKTHKDDWDPRVGYGWDFNVKTKTKTENEKEYPTLLIIKQKYEEDGELVNDIATFLNEKGDMKRDGKKWNTTSLSFVINKNKFEWRKGDTISASGVAFNAKGFWIDEENKKSYIKNLEIESKKFESIEEFKKVYGNEIYTEGKKVTTQLLNKYFPKDEKNNTEKKLLEKITFWLNETDKYYSNEEITKKIRSEFPDLKLSDQSVWRRIKGAKNEREKLFVS